MITFHNKHRSQQPEIMDNLDFGGMEMQKNLEDIELINKWLGGNKITIQGIEKLLKTHRGKKEITILDIGCGDGQMLRNCADFASKNGYRFRCIGIDHNPNILKLAADKSESYPNIHFQKVDVFLEQNSIPTCDIALFTLVLHHFDNKEIEVLLKAVLQRTTKGLVINDLHRSKVAFNFFRIFSRLLLSTQTAHHDGLVSIARGFKKAELQRISQKIPAQKSIIKWRWAFRYQWIMFKASH